MRPAVICAAMWGCKSGIPKSAGTGCGYSERWQPESLWRVSAKFKALQGQSSIESALNIVWDVEATKYFPGT
jgi:hypothetical protein